MDAAVPCRSSTEPSTGIPERKRSTESKILLLELAERLGSVSKACRLMDYSRDSFYRFRKLYRTGGERALEGMSRRRPILKNRVAPEVEEAVRNISLEHPTWGQARVAAVLAERGLSISAAGVRCVWLREQLQTTPLRLKAVESRTVRHASPAG
jgi:transposase